MNGRRRNTRCWTIIAVTVIAVACCLLALMPAEVLGAKMNAFSRPGPGGYRKVTVKEAGFTITVPNSWVTRDVTHMPVSKSFDKQHPELADVVPTGEPDLLQTDPMFFTGRAALVAVDTKGASPHAALLVAFDPHVYVERSVADFSPKKFGGILDDLEVTSLKLGRLQVIQVSGVAKESSLHSTQYFALNQKTGELQFFFATTDDGRQNKAVQRIVRSLKLLR
jgi:hypothetical protein